jgi:hypothetical protein
LARATQHDLEKTDSDGEGRRRNDALTLFDEVN